MENIAEATDFDMARMGKIQKEAEQLMNEIGSELSKDAAAELDTTLGMTNNMMGAVIGATLATGLELVSPTGTRASAAAAAITGAAMVYSARKMLNHPMQNKATAAVMGLISFKVCKTIGRNVVEYFPAQKETVEAVEAEAVDNLL